MFQVDGKVRSKVNDIYKGTYTIVKLNKRTAWVQADEGSQIMSGGKMVDYRPLYKDVPLSILAPA